MKIRLSLRDFLFNFAFVFPFVGLLSNLPARCIRDTYRAISKQHWCLEPLVPLPSPVDPDDVMPDVEAGIAESGITTPTCTGGPQPEPELEQIIAIALGEVTGSGTNAGFERLAARLQHVGVTVHPFPFDKKWWMDVVCISAMKLKRLDAQSMSTCLPGLGIPSHFAVMADPVSIGGAWSPHGELVAIAIGTCFANPIQDPYFYHCKHS